MSTSRYLRAQQLDDLYYQRDPGLMRLYAEFESRVRDEQVDVILVDNCPPYHPDWLRKLPAFKVLRIADGPLSAYDRDFAYAHAYDLVLYHSPAYSSDMEMGEKLRYIGARRTAFWPLGVFDAAFDPHCRKTNSCRSSATSTSFSSAPCTWARCRSSRRSRRRSVHDAACTAWRRSRGTCIST